MHHVVNFDDRLRPRRTAVISCPFAERPFDFFRSRHAFAFQNNFRRGGNRQAGEFAANDVHWLALNAADEIVLANSVRHFERAGEKDQRIMSHRDRNFERLAARERFVAMNAAVASRRDIETDGVLVMNHHPRRAQVGPAFFRIVGNIDAAGADIPAAVELEPARRRERQNIYIFAALNIFQHRPVAHHPRRNMLQVLRPATPFGDEFHGAQILRHAETQARAASSNPAN